MLSYSAPLAKWTCVYKKCGAQCCVGGREVTAGDLKRIQKVTGQKPKEFAILADEKGLFRLHHRAKDSKCYFLSDNFSCKLHDTEAKPILCQMHPFRFDGITYADEIVLKVKAVEDCPGFGKGGQLEADFKEHLESLGNKFVKELEAFLKLKHEGRKVAEALEAI